MIGGTPMDGTMMVDVASLELELHLVKKQQEEGESVGVANNNNAAAGQEARSVTVDSMKALTTAVSRYARTTVKVLKVVSKASKVDATEIGAILEAFPALEELSLDGLELDSEAFLVEGSSRLKVIRIRMERLSMATSNLSAFSVQAPGVLLMSLASDALQELELVVTGDHKFHLLQSCHLSEFWSKTPNLTVLALGKLYGMRSPSVNNQTTLSNNKLRCLRLEHCILESHFLSELLGATLESLTLSHCILHTAAVLAFETATKTCPLRYCRLEDVKLGIQSKANAMDVFLGNAFFSGTLECLSLQGTSVGEVQASTIHALLDRNPNLGDISGLPLDSTALFHIGLNAVGYRCMSPNRFNQDDAAWMTAVTRLADPQQSSLSSLLFFLQEHPVAARS